MSDLTEAYDNTFSLHDDIGIQHFDNNNTTEIDLNRLIHDRDINYNNIMISETLFSNNPIITQEDIDSTLNTYDIEPYIKNCDMFKSIMAKTVSELSSIHAAFILQSNKVDKLKEIHENISKYFSDEQVINNNINELFSKESKQLKNLEDQLVKIKKTLYIFYKHSPHYIENDPRKLCSICVQREVDVCNTPCGHTLCSVCSNMITNRKCFICRTEIQNVIKLYFS